MKTILHKIINHKSLIINSSRGNALITVIFFAAISISISTAAIVVLTQSIIASSKINSGSLALSVAESGAEDAVLRLLRNTSYTGEDITVDDGTAQITVTGTDPYVIRSTGTIDGHTRTVEVQVGYSSNILSILSWEEITP